MRKTLSLSSFKSIFPPIHQPLPLDARESQRLLDTLKTSFRRQLDKEYGARNHRNAPQLPLLEIPPITYLPSSSTDHLAGSSGPDLPRRPTDSHLHNILSNPLFSYDHVKFPGLKQAANASWEEHRTIFSAAVAKGLMTLPRALGFLLLIENSVLQSTSLSPTQDLARPGAGRLVLNWLRNSGQERRLAFVTNRRFMQTIVRFAVAEGLESRIWYWFRHALELDAHTRLRGALDDSLRQAASTKDLLAPKVLVNLVAHQSSAHRLDTAYASVIRGSQLLRSREVPFSLLKIPWKLVSWQTTIESWRHQAPPVGLFEEFVGLGEAFRHSRYDLIGPHLSLYHPSTPSTEQAVICLADSNIWEKRLPQLLESKGKNATAFIQRLTALGLDTVQHLVQMEETKEAQRILDRLRTHIPLQTMRPGQTLVG